MLTLWGLLQVSFTFTSREGKLVFKSVRMFCKKLLDPCQSLLMFTLKVSGRALGFLACQETATTVMILGLCLYFLTKRSFLIPPWSLLFPAFASSCEHPIVRLPQSQMLFFCTPETQQGIQGEFLSIPTMVVFPRAGAGSDPLVAPRAETPQTPT